MADAWALRRADLRLDMVQYAPNAWFEVGIRDVIFAEVGRRKGMANVQSLRMKLMVIRCKTLVVTIKAANEGRQNVKVFSQRSITS